MIERYAYRPFKMFVAFGGRKTFWWTRFLKKGFYHCFLVVNVGNEDEWLIIEHIYSFTDLLFVKGDALKVIQDKGYNLVEVTPTLSLKSKGYMLRPFTCVETVKHILGISNWFVFTQYQLFKYITRKKEEK